MWNLLIIKFKSFILIVSLFVKSNFCQTPELEVVLWRWRVNVISDCSYWVTPRPGARSSHTGDWCWFHIYLTSGTKSYIWPRTLGFIGSCVTAHRYVTLVKLLPEAGKCDHGPRFYILHTAHRVLHSAGCWKPWSAVCSSQKITECRHGDMMTWSRDAELRLRDIVTSRMLQESYVSVYHMFSVINTSFTEIWFNFPVCPNPACLPTWWVLKWARSQGVTVYRYYTITPDNGRVSLAITAALAIGDK